MKYYAWDEAKNTKLKHERGISFQHVVQALITRKLLDRIKHPNKDKYPNQYVFIVNIKQYAYVVPFVEDEKKIFLKTIIPSRKMTKKYIRGGVKNEKI